MRSALEVREIRLGMNESSLGAGHRFGYCNIARGQEPIGQKPFESAPELVHLKHVGTDIGAVRRRMHNPRHQPNVFEFQPNMFRAGL